MISNHLDLADLKSYLDGELEPSEAQAAARHIASCASCAHALTPLESQSALISTAFDALPRAPGDEASTDIANAWAGMKTRLGDAAHKAPSAWTGWRAWSLAGGLAFATLLLALTLTPVRAWAQSLLAVFRVQHFTVLELNAATANNLGNNELLNQTIGHVLSDQVTVLQAPQPPQPVADVDTASRLAGFPVKLLAGHTPHSLTLEGGAAAQMKLDRDRLQTILDEAGRNDIRIPASVDGATLSIHVPPGIMAKYGDCGPKPGPTPGEPCLSLVQLPSPVASMPQGIDPAQIAQVALEFFGMSAADAASFTRTVDWTSTLVLPIVGGQSSYREVDINGNQAVLLRPRNSQVHFTLMWVDSGIIRILDGQGDDTAALNLAAQLQ